MDKKKPPNPPENSIWMTIFFPMKFLFFWVFPTIWRGLFKNLSFHDIPLLGKENKAEYYEEKFDKFWMKLKNLKKHRLLSTLGICFGFDFFVSGLLYLISAILTCAIPYFMQLFLKEMSQKKTDLELAEIALANQILPVSLRPGDNITQRTNDYFAWIWLACIIFSSLANICFQQYSVHMSMKVSIRIKAVISNNLFKKILVLSNKAKSKYGSGSILTLLGTDLSRMEALFELFHLAWTGLLQVAISIYFLIVLIDWGALSGNLVYVFLVPVILACTFGIGKTRKWIAPVFDKRVNLITETIQGINIIKLFNLENLFEKKIKTIKKKELFFQFCTSLLFSINSCLQDVIVTIATVFAFATFFLLHPNNFDPIAVFTSLTYFNLVKTPISYVSLTLMFVSEFLNSLERIENILKEEETIPLKDCKNENFPIVIENASFKWENILKSKKSKKEAKKEKKEKNEIELEEGKEKDEEKLGKLEDISLKVKKGDLVMVCGNVGSGKSSLINAIIGEMKLLNGKVEVSGDLAYSPQSPWIKNDTLLGNITFGLPLDETKFDEVIKACALEADIQVLKGGRMIEIGEHGVNLSGGQKARISLARAVYSNTNTILLDSILSAVDAHVGKLIFNKCICGLLKEKTRILVTHHLQFCSKADCIVFLNDGKIIEQGSYQELMNKKGKFYELLTEYLEEEEEEKDEKEIIVEELNPKEESKGEDQKKERKNEKKEKLIAKEDQKKGAVSFGVIWRYLLSFGIFPAVVCFFLFFITEGFNSGTSLWISFWSSGTFSESYDNTYLANYYSCLNTTSGLTTLNTCVDNICDPLFTNFSSSLNCSIESRNFSIYWDSSYSNGNLEKPGLTQFQSLLIYASIGLGAFFFAMIRSLLFTLFADRSSFIIHNNALHKLLQAPMSYFNTQKLGRIIARFSFDTNNVDFFIKIRLMNAAKIIVNAVGSCGLMIYSTNGLFTIPLLFLLAIYLFFYFCFRKTNLDLKRIENVSRSPLLSHFQESYTGTSIIRIYRKEKFFKNENNKLINNFSRCGFMSHALIRWINVQAGLIGVLSIFCICALCILLAYYFQDFFAISIASLSLGVSYSIILASLLPQVVGQGTRFSQTFNSVERMDYFVSGTTQEPEKKKKNDPKPENWPSEGGIVVSKLNARYRKGLPLVLKDVDLKVSPKEKIGICGRTGSGKSSLINTLFRIIELESGKIEIDGKDISKLGLDILRQQISIIPQESVFFSGTIRSNLDPFNKHTDEKIWDALEKSFMKERINSQQAKLDSAVSNGGKNFSVGERQLLALARSLLEEKKIIVMDECSASISVDVDFHIQEMIKNEFSHCTILTIAHRLNTIAQNDKILVLDKGEVVEFDSPKNLLTKSSYSAFKALVEETGPNNAAVIRKLAGCETQKCKVLFEYKAKNDDEIDLKEGEIIEILEKPEKNYFLGMNESKKGLFPFNFVEIVE